MKYSYNWLKELSGTKLSAEKVADLLMLHSFEIEGIEKGGNNLGNVVVGEILEISKHPNADKLQVTKTNIGKEVLQIVCGANNISVGDKVPVALVGAKLPGGFEIKEAEIRGVKSFGMLCAQDELGLGNDHSGIFILDKSAKVGESLAKILDANDCALEIDVLANRAHDALSHVGIAREICALENKKMKYAFDDIKLKNRKTEKISVKIEDNKIAKRYIGAVIENIEIKESPEWMKSRLEKCGMRSINNIVDTTNYVMLELGQPLHAFDFEKIEKNIIVRRAKKDEELKLLDESVKQLSENDIVIADSKKAIALAGVMGGFDSAIDEKTKTIVLEVATFDATSIRKTRMNLGIPTDAALRFEKDIDPNIAEKAMTRAIEIVEHIANGKMEGVVDVYPKKVSPWKIKLDIEYVNNLLGEKIAPKKMADILKSLGIKVSQKGKFIEGEIPTFRLDLKTQEDLIEEIGRIYGYEKIKSEAPMASVVVPNINEKRVFERQIKNILASQGFSEVYNYSFYSKHDAEAAQLDPVKHLELQNPANPEQALLRISLIPNILKNVKENLKNYKEFNIFEIGNVYHKRQLILPEEKTMLIGAIILDKKGSKEEKQDKRHGSVFFAAKSQADGILEHLGIADFYYDNFKITPAENSAALWHISRSAEIKLEGSGEAVGFIGEINPLVLEQFDIRNRIAMFEFDLQKLQQVFSQEREYEPIGKFPVVTRDISLIAGKDIRVDEILMVIQKAGGKIVLDVDLFDAIDFADNTSSFAFHIILGNNDRTLTGKEIDDAINSIIMHLESDLNVKVRK